MRIEYIVVGFVIIVVILLVVLNMLSGIPGEVQQVFDLFTGGG